MSFANFDPNNKPVQGTNDWLYMENGEKRIKFSADCDPFECDVEVLEATSTIKYQASDNKAYEHLILTLGLIKGGNLSNVYHRVDIKGSSVINGVSQITSRIYNIFAIATQQRPDATKVLKQVTKLDFNKNEQLHDVLNMTGIKFKCLIACTGQYNGYNTYQTYFFAPSKQNYEEMIANDNSLTAFNKGLEKLKEARSKYLGGNSQPAGGYGAGYGAQSQQGYGATQQQQFNNFAGGQSFGNAPQQQTQAMQAVNSMQALQGVATQQPATALDDDLPF